MWEIAAIVELLEQKGLCTKQDLHTIINELRRKNPRASIPETAFPEPYLLTEERLERSQNEAEKPRDILGFGGGHHPIRLPVIAPLHGHPRRPSS
jgi:hypothetical protein